VVPQQTNMSPLPPDAYDSLRAGIPPTFHWPLKMCLAMSAATYVLSIITGNVSQVDRVRQNLVFKPFFRKFNHKSRYGQ
jgi:hypothetical protein